MFRCEADVLVICGVLHVRSMYLSIFCICHRVSSVGVVVITSALHAVGHGFETHTEYVLFLFVFVFLPELFS